MSTITTNLNFPTKNQVPDHSILDHFNKQTYLGNSFISVATNMIAGTTETALYLLTNPATSTVSLFLDNRKATCLMASHTAILNFYVAPTATAGTPVNPVNLRPANANTSKAILTLSPTASVNGTLVGQLMSSSQTSSQASTLIILDPGQSLLVTVTASNASDKVTTELGWYEL